MKTLFPGSVACKSPKFSEHGGRTWDQCRVVAKDASEHTGYLDTSWGQYFYFRAGGCWRKAKCVDFMGTNDNTADFRFQKQEVT